MCFVVVEGCGEFDVWKFYCFCQVGEYCCLGDIVIFGVECLLDCFYQWLGVFFVEVVCCYQGLVGWFGVIDEVFG